MTDEIGRSGSQRREETAPAGRAIPANNADGGGANVGHSGTKGDYCKNLFGPSETDGRHIHAWSCAWVEAIAGVSVSRTESEHVGRPQQTNGRSRVPHVNSRDSGEQSALWLSSDLYAAGLGWVEGASQEGQASLSAQRALIAPPSLEESRSGLSVMLPLPSQPWRCPAMNSVPDQLVNG